MRPLESAIRRMAQDLFVLEVNVILKETITARPISNLAHCLLDLVEQYERKLATIAPQLAEARTRALGLKPESSPDDPEHQHRMALQSLLDQQPDALWSRFHRLRVEAHALLRLPESTQLSSVDQMALTRIRGCSDELKGVLERLIPDESLTHPAGQDNLPPPSALIVLERSRAQQLDQTLRQQLEPSDQSLIRKLRDIMFEEVVLQTRIHLDGDISTRVDPRLMESGRANTLLMLHDKGVVHAVSFWSKLVEIGQQLIGVLFK